MSEFEREGRYDEPESNDQPVELDGAEGTQGPESNPEQSESNAHTDESPDDEETGDLEPDGGEASGADEVKDDAAEDDSPDKKKRKKIEINMPPLVKTTLVLFLITALSAALLAVVNNVTMQPIARHKLDEINNALSVVIPGATFVQDESVKMSGTAVGAYLARGGGQDLGIAVLAEPSGYGGVISLVVGVDMSGAVTGVSVVSMTETAGLGTKCQDPAYLARFIGKRAGVTIGRGENDVDAITGATVSSTAVTKGVADALATAAEYLASGEGRLAS